MVPTCIFSLKPLRAVLASLGMPHKGDSLGNSKNITTMTGVPSKAIHAAVLAACASGGLPIGICALTSTVSNPSNPISMLAAVSSDWE